MSTPCAIIIPGLKVGVYKHWDGDPESTLKWLQDFNVGFTKNRGEDPEYKLAALLRSSARDAETYGLDPSIHTGWAVHLKSELANDMCEYCYTLLADGTVTYTSC